MSQRKKTVVFLTASIFEILESVLIGELYYKDARKILLVTHMFSAHDLENMRSSSLFDEVLYLTHLKELEKVEQLVDDFIELYSPIDELFLCDIYQCFGTVLVHRLHGKAKLHRAHDGVGPFVATSKFTDIKFQDSFARSAEMKTVYEKYPFDESMFETYWTCSENIMLETPGLVVKRIALEDLLRDGQSVIEKLNIFFNYEDNLLEDYDAIYFDSWLAEVHGIEARLEQQILRQLQRCLSGKKILVKPKPGQNPLYAVSKFGDMNVNVYGQTITPWEVVYLNFLVKNRPKKMVLILPFFSSILFSSVYLSGPDIKLDILSLHEIGMEGLKALFAESFLKGTESVLNFLQSRSNVRLFAPKKMDEIPEMCERIFGGLSLKGGEAGEVEPYCLPTSYFYRVGNLLTESLISEGRGKVFHTYFDFLPETSELRFFVDDEVDLTTLKWRPSENWIFSFLSMLEIYVEGRDGRKKMVYCLKEEKPGDKITLSLESGHDLCLHTDYCGYCKTIQIETKLHARYTYVEMAKLLQGGKANLELERRAAFWENWYYIEKPAAIAAYMEANPFRNIWVLGDGKIGTEIKTAFDAMGVSTKFVGTRAKKKERYQVYLLTDMLEQEGLPDLFVIASMYDFQEIFESLPDELKERTERADELAMRILSFGKRASWSGKTLPQAAKQTIEAADKQEENIR